MFLDRVTKAFRSIAFHTGTHAAEEEGAFLEVSAPKVTAEQASAALKRADLHLTDDQRHVYLFLATKDVGAYLL